MEFYTVTVPAAEQPITLAEAKEFMKITSTYEDDLITALIVAATEALESYTGQVFVTRTIRGDFDAIYASKTEVYPWVKLRRAPLDTVASVQVSIDSTFVDESYQIKKTIHGFGRILFDDLSRSIDDIPYPLQIVFVSGYGAAADVPENIKTALKMYVNFMYRNKGDCIDGSACGVLNDSSGLGPIVKSMLNPYKIIEVYA